MAPMVSFAAVVALLASVCAEESAEENFWGKVTPGAISFKPHGICASGNQAYVGLLNPAKLTHPDKLFIEVMGGPSCFSAESCSSVPLKEWLDVDSLLAMRGIGGEYVGMLKSGMNVPLTMMKSLTQPGWVPFDADHPMAGRRGIFIVTCTGDAGLGKRKVTYSYDESELSTCNEAIDFKKTSAYRGCSTITSRGSTCNKWTLQTPHEHDNSPEGKPNMGLGDHNYCRDPDNSKNIWCYTTDPAVRWDWCDTLNDGSKQDYTVHHVGAMNIYNILTQIKEKHPKWSDIAIYGGSGGAIASAAWVPIIADMWPTAQARAFVDSGFHIIPGTKLEQYFYEKSPWGPGPAGQGPGLETDIMAPNFDWRNLDAVASHIASFDGRVTISFLACIDDHIVYSDRKLMSRFATFNQSQGDSRESLASKELQHEDTWTYLVNLHSCLPAGSIFSYIQNCTGHHQTNRDFPDPANPGMIDAKNFTYNVILGKVPDPDNPSKAKFWYIDNPTAREGSDKCPSEVRRRRAAAGSGGGSNTGGSEAPSGSTGEDKQTVTKETAGARAVGNIVCSIAIISAYLAAEVVANEA